MNFKRNPPVFFALLLVAATPRIARAQDDPRKAQAEAVFAEGLREHDAQHEEAALEKFQEAYKIYPSPNVLFNIGREEHLVGKPLEAIRHYRACLANPLLNPQNAELAKEFVIELQTKLSRIEITAPADAVITIDGEQQFGASPYDVPPGDHDVVVAVEMGGKKAEKRCHLSAGEVSTMDFNSELSPRPVFTGQTGVVTDAHTYKVLFPPPTGAAIVGGLGLVGLGVGVAFAIHSSSQHDSAESAEASHPCADETSAACQQLQDTNSAIGTSKTISEIAYVAGGVLVASGVVWWLAAPRERTEPAHILMKRTRVLPMIGPKNAGLGVVGDF